MVDNIEAVKSIYFGGGIKMISDFRVGGYLIRYGSANEKDLQGEYFTKSSELGLGWYEKLPMLYHHGLDGKLKAESIGVIDILREDDIGLWAEGQLDKHHRYIEAVKNLVNRGILNWSSGSLPHLVETSSDGHIKQWPIVEGSLTPTPAEPRQETRIQSIKSYKHHLETWLEAYELGQDVTNDDNVSTKHNATKIGEVEMTPEERQLLKEEIIAELMGMMKQEEPELEEEEEEVMKLAMEEETEEVLAEGEKAAEVLDEELDKAKANKFILAGNTRIIKSAYEARTRYAANKAQATKAAFAQAKQEAMKATPAPTAQEQAGGGGVARATSYKRGRYDNMTPADMSYMYQIFRSSAKSNNWTRWSPDGDFYRALADKCHDSTYQGSLSTLSDTAIKSLNVVGAIKADELDYSTQAGYGDDWVPELWANEVWNTSRLDNVMMNNLRTIEMPSNPYKHPTEAGDPTVSFVPETTDEADLTLSGSGNPIPDSKVGTANVTFTAKKLALRVGWSEELREDGITRLVPEFRSQADRTIRDAIDNVILNGDTAASGNINLDGGTPGATLIYKATDAIIKEALLANSGSRAVDMGSIAPTLAKIREARFKLKDGNNRIPDLMWVCDMPTYGKLLSLDEFITIDKAGPLATAQKGVLGFIDGVPLFPSAEMALADTDGKITDGGNTTDTGRLVLVHRPSWYVGFRRQITQSLTFIPYYDAWQLVNTVRLDLQARVKGDATDQNCAILYNIGV